MLPPCTHSIRSLNSTTTAFQTTHKNQERTGGRRTMYRTASPPLFDIPDFPTLRRVKPLPKRRRTSLDINPDLNVNIGTSFPGISPTLLPQSSPHSTYIPSTYHTHFTQPSSQGTLRTPDALPPVMDTQRSQYDWRLPPDFFLPEEILRAACVLPESGSTPRIDDGGGGDGPSGTEDPFLPPERKSPSSINPASLPITGTPPPPSDTSTDDEESRELAETPYHPTYLRSSKHHFNHEEFNPEDVLDTEAAEGDLQDRLFLRAETDRLLAQADSLSAKMALRSYYHSMGYGVPEFTSGAETSPPLPPSVPGSGINHLETVSANGMAPSNGAVGSVMKGSHSANAAPGNGYVAVGVGRTHGEEDGDGRGGDYTDHLNQQGQGNTKKRKVPANVGSSPPHHHHHHLHHYSSHRGTMGPYGSYGQPADVEGEEKELSFGLGFGLDLGSEATAEDPRSGAILGGVESDIFGPLPRPNETYAPQQHSVQVDPAHQLRPRQFHRKPKLSPATLAGLQRKELVRSRKKHLETIMGTIPVRDAWTLDHALSPNFPPLLASFASANSSPSSPSNSPTDSDRGLSRAGPTFVGPGAENDERWDVGWGWCEGDRKGLKMRLSKRGKMRFARMARMGLGRLGRHPDAAPFPTGEFTFSHPSATAERLVSIQEEVANLRNLFGRELARQTAKAAKIASGPSKSGGGSGKTGKKRAQQRAKTIMSAKSGEQQAEFLEMPQKGANSLGQPQGQSQVSQTQSQGQAPTPKKGKKKKRSTMANASNPHHLRNYVPSRLPHASGGGGSTGVNGQGNQATNANALWPLALKFLAADLPPRRRKDSTGRGQNGINVESLPHLVVPQEEWICSFCEYGLFYGEEAEYERALRNRKKILKRRRRARERASAAASGVNAAMKNAAGAAPVTEKTQAAGDDEEYDASGYEDAPPSSVNGRIDGTARTRARGLPAR